MSATYIGPLGRTLPVEYRPSTSEEKEDENSPPSGLSKMSTAHTTAPPRLPMPSGLQFGSDPKPFFSDPHRYKSVTSDRWPHSNGPPSSHHKLPPVSSLLPSPSALASYSHTNGHISPTDSRNGPPTTPGLSYHSSYPLPESPYTNGGYGSSYVARRPSGYMDAVSPSHIGPVSPSYTLPQHSSRDRTLSQPHIQPPMPQRYSSHSSDSSSTYHQGSRHELRTVPKPTKKCVGEDTIPGEGPCWVYEDGTRVRKEIDGETVNAQWGITKAGKPRKRLAIACVTCREKKIKCEPAEPKCVQCDKSGKECRFETAVRNFFKEPRTTSYEQQANSSTPIDDGTFDTTSPTSPTSQASTSRSALSDLIRKRCDPTSDDISLLATSKKARHGCIGEISGVAKACARDRNLVPFSQDHVNDLEDPFLAYPKLTVYYAQLYFANFNAGRYNVFPERPFMRWLTMAKNKSPKELMVLFAIMAVGSVYSNKQCAREDGSVFMGLVMDEINRTYGIFNPQSVQSRLLLSYYCLCVGKYSVAWALSGSAFRVAIGMKMHLEPEEDSAECNDNAYGFSNVMAAECHRRTFWQAFLFDRFQTFCVDYIPVIQKEDIFLRLPCNDKFYEDGRSCVVSYFDNGMLDHEMLNIHESSAHRASTMSFLIQSLSFAGDVLQQAHRTSHLSVSAYVDAYETFYKHTIARMEHWRKSLPVHFQLTEDNMRASIREGYNDTFVAVHAMYYLILVILQTNIRKDFLPPRTLQRNLRAAFDHSHKIFAVMRMLLDASPEDLLADAHMGDISPTGSMRHLFSAETVKQESREPFGLKVPFVAHIVYYACDVLSSTGPLSTIYLEDIVSDLNVGLNISERLAGYFDIAKGQCRTIRRRRDELLEILQSSKKSSHGTWRFNHCLQTQREEELSFVYGEEASMMICHILGVSTAPGTCTIVR